MTSPTFTLPACPCCSSFEGGLCQPFWKYAHNTSRARKRNCYFWVGCGHAQPVAALNHIFDDPADWQRIEQAWSERTKQMFKDQTAGWEPATRDRWGTILAGRNHVEGTTRELEFSPELSGSTQTNQDH